MLVAAAIADWEREETQATEHEIEYEVIKSLL